MPKSEANWVTFRHSSVLLLPVPAIIVVRSPATSYTVLITFSCSDQDKVGLSPVVPATRMPETPCDIWNSTSWLRPSESTL